MFNSLRLLPAPASRTKPISRPFWAVAHPSQASPAKDTASGLRPLSAAMASGPCPCCGAGDCSLFLAAPDRFHGRTHWYHLARCGACSLVWLADAPPMSEMGEHYGADYNRAIAGGGADPDHWRGRRDELLRHKSHGAVLDLGCSSGGFLTSMKSSSWELYGIEMSDEVAKMAEARTGAQVFVGNIADATFQPGSFDAITCFHVFEHLDQPKEVLAKVAEWLKPGGIFYVMVPNIDSAGRRIFRSYWYALELPRHLFHYSPKSLGYLASSVGLQPLSVTTHREVFIEASWRYIMDEFWQRIGSPRAPMAQAKELSFPRKAIRKIFRLTALPILTGLASLAGDGESIHAIFVKAER